MRKYISFPGYRSCRRQRPDQGRSRRSVGRREADGQDGDWQGSLAGPLRPAVGAYDRGYEERDGRDTAVVGALVQR
jgi:hypothetical protein